jgi:hypothetical protein
MQAKGKRHTALRDLACQFFARFPDPHFLLKVWAESTAGSPRPQRFFKAGKPLAFKALEGDA